MTNQYLQGSINRGYNQLKLQSAPLSTMTSSFSNQPPDHNTFQPHISYLESEKQLIYSLSNPPSDNKTKLLILAWMFLQLVLFYTNIKPGDISKKRLPEQMNTISFAIKRPVFGIYLQLLEWSSGHTKLNTKLVQVPPVIHLASFAIGENYTSSDSKTPETGTSKCVLALKSAIFHCGLLSHSGHFVALVKENINIGYHSNILPNSTVRIEITLDPNTSTRNTRE